MIVVAQQSDGTDTRQQQQQQQQQELPLIPSPFEVGANADRFVLVCPPERRKAPSRRKDLPPGSIEFDSLRLPRLIGRAAEVSAILEHCGKVYANDTPPSHVRTIHTYHLSWY